MQEPKEVVEEEKDKSIHEDVHVSNDKKIEKFGRHNTSCHCSIMDRQQREIVNLKRKLQEKEVYGASTKSEGEHRYVIQ